MFFCCFFCSISFDSFVFVGSILKLLISPWSVEMNVLIVISQGWEQVNASGLFSLYLPPNWYGFLSTSLLSSEVNVALRSRCGGKWGVLVLRSLPVPEVQGGRNTQGLTVITGARSGRSRTRTRGSLVAAGESVDPAGTVREIQISPICLKMKAAHKRGGILLYLSFKVQNKKSNPPWSKIIVT